MLDPILNSIRGAGKVGKKTKAKTLPISSLERCPPKICKLIFAYACDDDGTTGRVLSSVSRYINYVSGEVKFRSIAICGMKQIFFCAAMLRKRPPHLRGIVHLFISAGAQVRPGETRDNIEEWVYSTETHQGSGCDAFFEILSMAAPTMKSLYVSSPCARPMVFLNIKMPELEELTFFNEIHANPTTDPPSENYPKLKRLRFGGCSHISRTVLTEIYAHAPNVTHVFLQLGRTGDDLLEHLASVFGLKGIRNDHPWSPLPKKFLNQIVEVRIEAPNRKKGFQARMYERLIKQITAREPRIKVVTIPTSYSIQFCYSLQDWLRGSTRRWNFPTSRRIAN